MEFGQKKILWNWFIWFHEFNSGPILKCCYAAQKKVFKESSSSSSHPLKFILIATRVSISSLSDEELRACFLLWWLICCIYPAYLDGDWSASNLNLKFLEGCKTLFCFIMFQESTRFLLHACDVCKAGWWFFFGKIVCDR